jgi:hypothetical protein
MGAAPPPLADSALRKRAEERMCMGAESATVLNCKWDQGVPPPWILEAGRSEILSAYNFLSSTSLAAYPEFPVSPFA